MEVTGSLCHRHGHSDSGGKFSGFLATRKFTDLGGVDLSADFFGFRFSQSYAWCAFCYASYGLWFCDWLAAFSVACRNPHCLASLTAYLCGQALDILVFDRLRNAGWWKAPLFSSLVAATTDSVLFFTLAFAYSGADWLLWCLGDTGVKLLVVVVGLPLYRSISLRLSPATVG